MNPAWGHLKVLDAREALKKAHHTVWSHLTPHSHILRVATHRYHIQLEASGSLPYELYPESRGNKK